MNKNSKLPISLIVMTLNEEQMIGDCLDSVPWCNEKLVFDTGSVDQTKKVAEAHGAVFHSSSWEGFGKTKQKASPLAQNDWILSLDADERLSPELGEEIQNRFERLDPQQIYYFPRRSFYLNRWIGYGGWYPDYQARLFHRSFSNWNQAEIHEEVVPNNTSEKLQEKLSEKRIKPGSDRKFSKHLIHFVFRNLSHQVQTNNRYSSLQAEELFAQGKKFSLFKLLTKPWVKFIENYFWKRGFLDGLAGFVIAVGSGYSVFLKWAKLWELQNTSHLSS
ncbi:MAG: glycosyltransferase family 2 protein, partial [Pseudobdellovibrionaceae bacterium]